MTEIVCPSQSQEKLRLISRLKRSGSVPEVCVSGVSGNASLETMPCLPGLSTSKLMKYLPGSRSHRSPCRIDLLIWEQPIVFYMERAAKAISVSVACTHFPFYQAVILLLQA